MTSSGAGHVAGSGQAGGGTGPAGNVPPQAVLGEWDPVLEFPNVPIHVHVLADGTLLMWGRRDEQSPSFQSLHEHFCTPFIWDPADPVEPAGSLVAKTTTTARPTLTTGDTVNLFCGGHAFLPDGRLLAVGGHLFDGSGVSQASLYTPGSNGSPGTWNAQPPMKLGRWYPTATTLPDGSVLVMGGSYRDNPSDATTPAIPNPQVEVWSNHTWRTLPPFPDDVMDYFPRAHVLSSGKVFIAGTLQATYLLDPRTGAWEKPPAATHAVSLDYGPSIMYERDKIVYIGGGVPPTNQAWTIDCSGNAPGPWTPTPGAMHFPRRQHTATLLADGTVLVTGGTRGTGPTLPEAFNDLKAGMPVHEAELWDPATGEFTVLDVEKVDRCYHSTAVLLPDATVLSAGGGEFPSDDGTQANPPGDSHLDGQIFTPPYLFWGPRPEITSAPAKPLTYGKTFEVASPQADQIGKVTWIRLSSCTHSFNQSQRINFLDFRAHNGRLLITAPASSNLCPPGHHMLFILSKQGVPSVARVLQIRPSILSRIALQARHVLGRVGPVVAAALRPSSRAAEDLQTVPVAGEGTRVVVGLTSVCPYGLSACWGGAHEALRGLEGVGVVNHIANASDSTAEVWLHDNGLPQLDRWQDSLRRGVNERYVWRGVEVTLRGAVELGNGSCYLAASEPRPAVELGPLQPSHKIQWDSAAAARQPVRPSEADAYQSLLQLVSTDPTVGAITVTGPLTQIDSRYSLEVREFHA